ncbi:MAG: hypothetical protein LC777_20405, partial [Actinobacteria bacterium]|nr:hypothetical protein [Actinomycetota bacterium]
MNAVEQNKQLVRRLVEIVNKGELEAITHHVSLFAVGRRTSVDRPSEPVSRELKRGSSWLVDALSKIFVAFVIACLGALSAVGMTACGDDESEEVELSVNERDLSPGRVQV